MAKLIRSMSVAVFAAFLCSFLPGLASAQGVHEVRPAGADEVRIGVDGPASMEAVVALARRITGNPALTVDDVVANLPHARRYACRAGGRLVYFGTDPDYGGRCPDDGVRIDGVLRGAVYRIPREHGAVLPPVRRARPRPAVALTADPSAVEARVLAALRDVERLTNERDTARRERDEARERYAASETSIVRADEARATAEESLARAEAERDSAIRERDEARTALAARPATPTIVSVGAPGEREEIERLTVEAERLREENARLTRELEAARHDEVTFESRIGGRPIWGLMALLALVVLAVAFILFGLVVLPQEKRPLVAHIGAIEEERDRIETARVKAEGNLMAKNVEAEDLAKDLRQVLKKHSRAMKSRERWFDRWRDAAAELESYAQRYTAFQVRKDRIEANHAKLVELRRREDEYDVHVLQMQEAEDYLREAEERGDATQAGHCRQVIAECERQLERKMTDPSFGNPQDIKAEIAGLVASLARDMQLQCGLNFDGRSSDEWKSEWEDRKRGEQRKAEAAKHAYQGLVALVEQQGLDGLAEIAKRRRELEDEFTAKDGAVLGTLFALAAGKSSAEAHLESNMRTLRKLKEENGGLREEAARLQAEIDEQSELLRLAATDDPNDHVRAITALGAQNADFKKRLRELGHDPDAGASGPKVWPEEAATDELPLPGKGNGTPALGVVRPRVPTQGMTALRESQIPGPPSSPMGALNRDIYRFLDTLRSIPQDAWIIDCNDDAGRDWAFLLNNCHISAPKIGMVLLRKYVEAVKKRAPDWLTDRVRLPTNPPPASAAG